MSCMCLFLGLPQAEATQRLEESEAELLRLRAAMEDLHRAADSTVGHRAGVVRRQARLRPLRVCRGPQGSVAQYAATLCKSRAWVPYMPTVFLDATTRHGPFSLVHGLCGGWLASQQF